ncbi:hypothetical protein T8J41_02740 [Nitratireductor rhodophyticola]|uniref:hypothetical protein n=1 Tax=Nitratireductor rhodophyticola TaxID=2854036 RepID=UPI002AC8C6A1|nr:hypothetical protein [Nitratireductor rhodophyticola]WPZ14760.1 hypothetical protein T8J41_02740 [Nitratireductor rhodophyticola]
MNLKSLVSCCGLLLLACEAGFADERGARLFQAPLPFSDEMHPDIATLYGGRSNVLRRYAWAMSANRHVLASQRGEAVYGQGFAAAPGEGGVSAFVGANDRHVLRLGGGALVIAHGEPLANLYAEIDCEIDQWPVLVCRDGRARSISAPDTTTILIEGETFELAKNGADE